MEIITNILDFIVPRVCTSCNIKLSFSEQFICKNCLSQINELSTEDIASEYKRKFSREDYVDDYTSLFVFEEKGKLQDLIHALKYNQKFKIGIFLGELLGDRKENYIKNWNTDLVIPVPLFHLKKIERGYNQADFIAKGLAQSLGILHKTSIATRIKNTSSQTKLDSTDRLKNMQDAFAIRKPKAVVGKKIIIIDDVITTGITVLELAKRLKENGAEKVYVLSVATPLISHSVGSSKAKN